MSSLRYHSIKFFSSSIACLIVGFLCLTTTLLAQEPWTQIADMLSERGYVSSSAVDGKVYAIGGGATPILMHKTMEMYDPATLNWAFKDSMDTSKQALSTSVVDGKIYALGGATGGFPWSSLSNVEVYDPATDMWEMKENMPTPRQFLASCMVDRKIYAIGGGTGPFSPVSIMEVYDPDNDTWDTTKASMSTAKISLSACAINGKIYVIGGATVEANSWISLQSIEVYDPMTDTWDTTKSPMPTPRHSLSTSVIDGKIYAIGGNNGTDLNTVEVYDPETDIWKTKTSMPTPRRGHAASVLNERIYVMGGTAGRGKPGMQTVELYDPASDWFHGQIAHGETLTAHPKYVAPQTETLIVNAKLHNPLNHTVMVYAMIQSDDLSFQDSLEMFDDGLHFDENAGDGIWGARCMTPPDEGMYKASVKTVDMDSSITINSLLFNIYDRFTTIGPVQYDTISYLFNSTPKPGSKSNFYIHLKNTGLTSPAQNISAEIICEDTYISLLSNMASFTDISAGEAVKSQSVFSFKIDSLCAGGYDAQFTIKIMSSDLQYWSDTFSINIPVSAIPNDDSRIPKEFVLHQNHPNPFNPSTKIKFELPKSETVIIEVYNILGQKIQTLLNKSMSVGFHEVEFNGENLSSGVYLYRIEVADPARRTGAWQDVKKMVLLR